MLMSDYLFSMSKMERLIVESAKGSYDYFKYLDFYKSVDKELLEFLNH
jgi:hypothetical protein